MHIFDKKYIFAYNCGSIDGNNMVEDLLEAFWLSKFMKEDFFFILTKNMDILGFSLKRQTRPGYLA